MHIYNLTFKWTVSRGRNTYGYNICSLYVDGIKVSSCNGGGYDMQGTCFAEYINIAYHQELIKLFEPEFLELATKPHDKDYEGNELKYKHLSLNSPYYGVTLYQHLLPVKYPTEITQNVYSNSVVLNGASGFDSMKRIAEKLDLQVQYNPMSERYKNSSFYNLIAP